MHWAQEYVGKPWRENADGPDAFDCWGLVRHVYRQQLKVELPPYPGLFELGAKHLRASIRDGLRSGKWVELVAPKDLCAVLMSASRVYDHVGVYLAQDGGLILHSVHGRGVVAQPRHALLAIGIQRTAFYSYGALH